MECSRSGCPFLRHPNPANNGGTHCCAACKSTGDHGSLCRQISLEENKRKKKRTTTTGPSTTGPTTKATTTTGPSTTGPTTTTTGPTTTTTGPTTGPTTTGPTTTTTSPTTTTIAPTIAPTTIARLPVVKRTSDSGTVQTFYAKKDEYIKISLFAEWNFSFDFRNPGLFPGSSHTFTFWCAEKDCYFTLSNKDMTRAGACIVTYNNSYYPSTDPYWNSFGPTVSTYVRRNSSATLSLPMVEWNGGSREYPVKPPEMTAELIDKLSKRSLNGGGGYWEIEGRLSDTP